MKRKIKLEDIVFWILVLAAIGVAVWLFLGSPTIETGLLMIVIFIAGSEILLWKTIFNMDKRTAVGFVKLKNDLNNARSELNIKLENIENLIENKRFKK